MKSIVQQYRDLNEGKMSKANFMTNVRRQFPDWISSVNSYQDAISILKSKRILSEELGSGSEMTVSSAIEHIFDGDFDGNPLKLIKAKELVSTSNHPDKAVTLHMIEKKLEDALDAEMKGQMDHDKAQWDMEMNEDESGKQKEFAALAPPRNKITYADKIAGAKLKKEEEVSMEGKKPFYLVSDSGEIVDSTMAEDETEARQYFENEYEGIGSSMTIIHTNNPDEIGDVYAEDSLNEIRKKKPSTGLSQKKKSAIVKKAKAGGDIGKKGKGFEKIEKTAEKKYGSKEAGEKVAAAAMWKSQAKKATVKEAKEESEGYYKHVTGKDEYSVFDEIDRVNPYEFKRGVNIEMGMQYKPIPKYFTPEFNPETLAKATKKVLKNLEKDPAYYTNMISAEFEKKSGLLQHPKELKVGPDGRAKIPGFTDAKSNTETNQSKKERAKGGPEGVKEMKPSKKSMGGIKTMKSNDKLPKGVELMKESLNEGGDYTFNGHFKTGELAKLKQQIPDAEIDTDTEEGQSVKTTVMSKKYNEKTIQQAVNNVLGMGKSNEFPIKGQMMEDKKAKQLKKIKETVAKKIKEDLYKNTKSGNVQSFNPADPADQKTIRDPKFNQVFKKA